MPTSTSEMLSNYLRFSQLRFGAYNTNKLDLSAISWFQPTLLLPLGLHIKQNPDIDVILPSDPDVNNYFNIIMETGSAGHAKTYIPIIKLPKIKEESHAILCELNPYAANDCGGITALQCFVGELSDNIYQHSEFSTAYIMSQRYPKSGFLEFCIIDNGISIPCSYKNAGILTRDDKMALDYALDGVSTKGNTERGTGLRDSIKVLTYLLGGECLIVSRQGKLLANKAGRDTSNINKKDIYDGTLIGIRVPFQRSKVNIYDVIS